LLFFSFLLFVVSFLFIFHTLFCVVAICALTVNFVFSRVPWICVVLNFCVLFFGVFCLGSSSPLLA